MRILYGVFGYGRGHATRALGVLPELTRRHEVHILAGGDAFDAIQPHFAVRLIPTLRYEYGPGGTRCNVATMKRNGRYVQDLFLGGPSMARVRAMFRDIKPDLVIADAEPWTHRVAEELRIPRISFDHFGILAYARPEVEPTDRLRYVRDSLAYRAFMGRPDRVVVSSFYEVPAKGAGVTFVGPLLRDEVRALAPTNGDHLLVYLNQGQHQLTARLEETLHAVDAPVRVYGAKRVGDDRRLSFRPPSNEGFLRDLASAKAVFSTAGNQLVGEALHFGKAMLVAPEEAVEQRLNAAAVARMGIGRRTSFQGLTPGEIDRFLADAPDLGARARHLSKDGRAEALDALERFGRDLVRAKARGAVRGFGFA